MSEQVDVAVIGAGSVGIAVAYYLVTQHSLRRVVLIDPIYQCLLKDFLSSSP